MDANVLNGITSAWPRHVYTECYNLSRAWVKWFLTEHLWPPWLNITQKHGHFRVKNNLRFLHSIYFLKQNPTQSSHQSLVR